MELLVPQKSPHVRALLLFLFVAMLLASPMAFGQNYGTPTRYEAENGFNDGLTTASTNTGFSGTGYVTGFTQANGSQTKFDHGVSGLTPTKVVIGYANGTGSTVTNMALYVGTNQKIQDLVLPSTGSWSTWSTVTVTFNHDPSWGSNIIIRSTAAVATSANIDYTDLSIDDGTAPPAASPTFSPVAGTYTSTQNVSISSTTTGASIYYTIDGSTPTTSSSLYSAAVVVASSKTVKAIAVKTGFANSAEASAAYTINLPTAATPTFSPVAGTYTSAQSVALSSTTTGASIYYTIDGSTPTTSSSLYSTAINVAASKTIKAIAVKSGFTTSAIGSAAYTINLPAAAAPTFSPAGGSYSSAQSVSLSSTTTGASIYYTTDGSTPTTASALYSTAINVAATTTVKAIAAKSGMSNSSVASATYTITVPTVATPTFSPVAGTYTSTQSVVISSATTGASIYYTTDNSTPTTSSTLYSAAVTVASTKTIKALGVKSGLANSAVASALYTINTPPPAPGAFLQTAPASGATSVNVVPTFTWGASSNASSYTLVVATNTSYTTPIINQSGITSTSFTPSSPLSASTLYYWKVIATNSTASTTDSNAGTSFTTASAPTGQPGVTRQYWAGIAGANVSDLTSSPNYPNSPTSTSVLSTFEAPSNVALSYGQRVSGYLTAPSTGTYKFWIASDDNSELWLSTNGLASNKVKIASVTGWTNPQEYGKYSSQASANISLTAGTQYYIEALMKQDAGGDNLSVAWQIPGGSQVVIPGSALSTALTVPVPAPGAFTQSAPTNGATGVSVTPAFSWTSSSDAVSYSIVVATNSSYTTPVINQAGLTSTSFTPSVALSGNTLYYWKVTATNTTASTVATNAGVSFTTLVPPAPGAFTQTSPAAGATAVSTYPAFSWAASSNAASYSILVSTNSAFTSPVINTTGLTATSYSPSSPLAVSTLYYWKVSAVNGTGTTVATNAGISFTTAATTGTNYYVSYSTGSDVPGNGTTSGSPWKTLAYAATQVTAGTGNKTINLAAGTYIETACTILPLGVNVVGAGESNTILTTNGVLPTPGVDQGAADYHLWADGSLIQLKSPIYSGANPRYGDPSLMIAAQDGNQTLSGFKIDGHNKTVKAGIWVENRNNVTVHHITFNNLQQSGAVFSRGDMYYYVVLPDGKWMMNTSVHDLTFTNSGSTSGGEQVGNLCLGGLDGAQIYNINITDPNGEGIKFEHVGHFRNTVIHDCNITVGETDPTWGEKISIELWNMSYNNEVYNINCNTWLSMVNHYQLNAYQPTAQHPSNLKIHGVVMIDGDGVNGGVESIECALSGVEIYDSYFQDKGFGIAIWGGQGWGGTIANHAESIHNNIFARVNIPASFGFGNSAAVFVPDPANTISIYNNVFDNLGNSLQLDNATGVDIKNNIFQNSQGDDIQGGSSLTIKNNLRYNTDPQRQAWLVSGSLGTGNIQGNPQLKKTGSRATTYYQPSSGTSFVVDKGIDVGIPFSGTNPDIGRWEFGTTSFRTTGDLPSEVVTLPKREESLNVYPNPTTGKFTMSINPEFHVLGFTVNNLQGQTVLQASGPLDNLLTLDLSSAPNEIYFLRVKHDRGVLTTKVIVRK